MKNGMSEKSKIIGMFTGSLCSVLSALILLCSVTYGWIRRQWSSTVSGEEIRIEANGSLAFILENNEGESAVNAVNVCDIIGISNFVLKPVSNLSGESDDFFTLDKANVGNETYLHLMQDGAITSAGWTNLGKTYGYIEFRFLLLGENAAEGGSDTQSASVKYIYLKSDSTIGCSSESYNADNAMRVSVTDEIAGKTYIFMNRKADAPLSHSGVNNITNSSGSVWYADGQYYREDGNLRDTFDYGSATYQCVNTIGENDPGSNLHVFSDFDGGIETDETTGKKTINPDKALLSFMSNESRWITVRVWLEGTDSDCTDDIAGMQIDFLLSFEAVNCRVGSNVINEPG